MRKPAHTYVKIKGVDQLARLITDSFYTTNSIALYISNKAVFVIYISIKSSNQIVQFNS